MTPRWTVVFLALLLLPLLWAEKDTTVQLPSVHRQEISPQEAEAGCLGCHEGYRPRRVKHPHQGFEEESCVRCHQDHGETPPKEHLPTERDMYLCYECHKKSSLGRSHPTGATVIEEKSGKMMTCTSFCHNPHGSNYADMLRDDGKRELCIGCHQEFAKRVSKKKRRLRFF